MPKKPRVKPHLKSVHVKSLRDPVSQRRFKKARAYWTEQARPLIEACENAERLTAADYAIRITI